MAEELTLDSYLHSLCAEASWVDSGAFQLDAKVALEKLENFQYAEPTTYFFPLVAAAAPLKARGLRVSITSTQLRFFYHCAPLELDKLQGLFRFAFSPRREGLRHLALGVLGATRLQKVRVEISSGAHRVGFAQRQSQVLPSLEPVAGIQLDIQRTGWAARGWALRLGLSTPLETPPLGRLQSFLRYCPVPVEWNRHNMGGLTDWPKAPAMLTLTDAHGEYPVPQIPSSRLSPGEYSAVLALQVQEPGLHWVVDGMTFSEDPKLLGFPWARAVLVGPWNTDVSYQRLVRDELYQRVLEQTREHLEVLALQLKPRIELQEQKLDIMAHLAARWKIDDQDSRVEELYLAVMQALEAVDSDHYEFALSHSLLGEACRHFRLKYSSVTHFTLWFRASSLLTRPALAPFWCHTWELSVELAEQVFGAGTPPYRRFLLQVWGLWGCASPSLVWSEWRQHVLLILPRAGDVGVTELEEFDQAVARQMYLVEGAAAEEIIDFCQQARGQMPVQFLSIHNRLDNLEQEATFRLRAERYRSRS
jgi:hypothetical protein